MLRDIIEDARQLTEMATGRRDFKSVMKVVLSYESFAITTLNRIRGVARAWHIFGIGHYLRVLQSSKYGIEIAKDVKLGHGVWFIHTVGIVIGGNSKVGDRVRFFGSNTLGQAKEDGYPTLEDDVWVGAGARILGPITVGARARIGANAVVLQNVPADAVAVGIPARIIVKGNGASDASTVQMEVVGAR